MKARQKAQNVMKKKTVTKKTKYQRKAQKKVRNMMKRKMWT